MKPRRADRRTFLVDSSLSMGALLLGTRSFAQTGSASLHIQTSASGTPISGDFIGLSYESAQLANPAFFSAGNRELVSLFRELSPSGNLRLGGGASEFTTFQQESPAGPPPFEVFGPDTSKTEKHGTVTSAAALRSLRSFLDATGWNCLYGLNLGQGSVENAVAEARTAQGILGPRLVAFQIGNEPDSFRRRYRPETYGPADFIAEWKRFHDAIAAAVPGARFAGPDISNKLPYLTAFAAEAPLHKDVTLLTGHYYAMGPSGNPGATIDNLLDPDPKLTTLKRDDLHIVQEAREAARLPYRMSEGNSCWDGGKAGVSDVYASALWCATYALGCMSRGWVGINMHGGGNGFYTPIAGSPSKGFVRRPEFYGLLFAQHFAGARVAAATLQDAPAKVDAYYSVRGAQRECVIVNKTAEPMLCRLPARTRGQAVLRLEGPAIDATSGVAFSPVREKEQAILMAPPYTATVYRLR